MHKTIVVVGSINIDLVLRCPHLPQAGETVTGGDLRTLPGGKGANQAVAAARMGGSVALVGCVGADTFGQAASAALRAEGIALDGLHMLADCATGVAMVQVDDAGQNCIALAPGANARLSPLHLDLASASLQQAGLLVCQLESPLAAVQQAIAVAHAAGVPVLLNPAPAQALPADLLPLVDLLVLNEGEAAVVSGLRVQGPADAEAAACRLRSHGAGTVVVTLGADGVVWVGPDNRAHRRPAQAVQAVDTTGAGGGVAGRQGPGGGHRHRAACSRLQRAAAWRAGSDAAAHRCAARRPAVQPGMISSRTDCPCADEGPTVSVNEPASTRSCN